jgi:signal transduction histidine kinase
MTTQPIPAILPAAAPAEPRSLLERPLVRWGVVFALWTVLGFLSISQTVIFFASEGRPINLGPIVVARLADWYTCALFTPAFFWLARHYPVDRERWRIGLPVHLLAAGVFVLLKYLFYHQVRTWIEPADAARDRLRDYLAAYGINEFLVFVAVIGVVHAIEFYRRYRSREIQAERLRTQLAEARIEALSSQLRPHFLFNTLQGVSTLMYRDVAAADTMLGRLSDLLRRTLQQPHRHEVSLGEELATLEDYVGIMRMRFQDRLVVETRVPESIAGAQVPRLVLQPLVENALEHGIARRAGAGRIEIRADRDGDVLRLSVTDDGAGVAPAQEFPTEGVGLGNTRLRLRELYGSRQSLELEPLAAGGLRVSLSIPYREGPA